MKRGKRKRIIKLSIISIITLLLVHGLFAMDFQSPEEIFNLHYCYTGGPEQVIYEVPEGKNLYITGIHSACSSNGQNFTQIKIDGEIIVFLTGANTSLSWNSCGGAPLLVKSGQIVRCQFHGADTHLTITGYVK